MKSDKIERRMFNVMSVKGMVIFNGNVFCLKGKR